MSTNDLLTLFIALYGAVIATILGFRELRRDRRRIRIILEYLTFYERTQITIVNVGNRPITILEISVAMNGNPSGKEFWQGVPRNALFDSADDPLPITLTDGEHITLPFSEAIDSSIFEKNAVRVSVYDIDGNIYRSFKKRIHDPKWGDYVMKP